jgi:hypothetical protein
MTRKLALAVLTLAISTSLFAETTTRYMVVMRRMASGTSPRLAANSADAAEHRLRRFDNAGSMAMDLTSAEAAELRRSGDVASIEPVIDIYAQSDNAPAQPAFAFQQQEIPWGVRASPSSTAASTSIIPISRVRTPADTTRSMRRSSRSTITDTARTSPASSPPRTTPSERSASRRA